MSAEQDNQHLPEGTKPAGGLPIGLLGGIALGMLLGVALDDYTIGVALSVTFGICGSLLFGSLRSSKQKHPEGQDETPSSEEQS